MPSLQRNIDHERLKSHVKTFFDRPVVSNSSLPLLMRNIEAFGCPAVFFGGFLRDLAVYGPSVIPRDIDIVVDGPTNDELFTTFKHRVVRRTRFGGVVVDAGPCHIDVWSLASTWAFRSGALRGPSLHRLPKTTFLDIEAIVLHLPFERMPRLIEYGFFEAIERRELEINFELNPYPALCVARSLIFARTLRFGIGKCLRAYILKWSERLGINAIEREQLSHYGKIIVSTESLEQSLDALSRGGNISFIAP